MSFFIDLGTVTMIASGERIRAIGWLDDRHDYTRGSVPPDFLTRLKLFTERSHLSGKALQWGMFCGLHTCELCGRVNGWLNCGVPYQGFLFVFPELVVHYIEAHSYRPPDVFVTAVMNAPLPGSSEYLAEVVAIFPALKNRPKNDSELKFFHAIGPEIGPEVCRHTGCTRKTVQCSVHCRSHHFEIITGTACPFSDDDYIERLKPKEINLARWLRSGEPQNWVRSHQSHAGQWSEEDKRSLLDSLKKSDYWPLRPKSIWALLQRLGKQHDRSLKNTGD
jgi:hypothetical protein